MNTSDKIDLWKIKLADAIIEEAAFNGCPVEPGTKIEHQLGTVWVGNAIISSQPGEQGLLDKELEKSDMPQ